MTDNKETGLEENSFLIKGERKNNSKCLIKEIETKKKEFIEEDLVWRCKNKIIKPGARLSNSQVGGRLQFFKDGKFIFELARSFTNGKCSWVAVQKKSHENISTINTTNGFNQTTQDINNSIQSLPWPRRLKWKQSHPKKNCKKHFSIIFKRNKSFNLTKDGKNLSLKKRRQPFNEKTCKMPFEIIKIENEAATEESEVKVCIKSETEKCNIEIPKNKLADIVDRLLKRVLNESDIIKLKNPTQGDSNIYVKLKNFENRQNISPRKRILKELEKVTLEDASKKSRSKDFSEQKETIIINKNEQMKTANEIIENMSRNSSSSSKFYSNYSIHSLLGNYKKGLESPTSAAHDNVEGNNIDKVNNSSKRVMPESLNESLGRTNHFLENSLKSSSADKTDNAKSHFNFVEGTLSKNSNTNDGFPDRNNSITIPNYAYYDTSRTINAIPSNFSEYHPFLQSRDAPTVEENSCNLRNKRKAELNPFDECKSEPLNNSEKLGFPVGVYYNCDKDDLLKYSTHSKGPYKYPSRSNLLFPYIPYSSPSLENHLWMHHTPLGISSSLNEVNSMSENTYNPTDFLQFSQSIQFRNRYMLQQYCPDAPISLCIKDNKKQEENGTDVPLNLSKH